AALLEIARRRNPASQGPAEMAAIARQPFYRLSPLERFLLAVLHRGRWSYARTARGTALTPHGVQKVAVKTRLHQVSLKPGRPARCGGGGGLAARTGREDDCEAPWPEGFVDGEFVRAADRFFLQTHLMAGEPCRAPLHRCRDPYYTVESLIPPVEDGDDFLD